MPSDKRDRAVLRTLSVWLIAIAFAGVIGAYLDYRLGWDRLAPHQRFGLLGVAAAALTVHAVVARLRNDIEDVWRDILCIVGIVIVAIIML